MQSCVLSSPLADGDYHVANIRDALLICLYDTNTNKHTHPPLLAAQHKIQREKSFFCCCCVCVWKVYPLFLGSFSFIRSSSEAISAKSCLECCCCCLVIAWMSVSRDCKRYNPKSTSTDAAIAFCRKFLNYSCQKLRFMAFLFIFRKAAISSKEKVNSVLECTEQQIHFIGFVCHSTTFMQWS